MPEVQGDRYLRDDLATRFLDRLTLGFDRSVDPVPPPVKPFPFVSKGGFPGHPSAGRDFFILFLFGPSRPTVEIAERQLFVFRVDTGSCWKLSFRVQNRPSLFAHTVPGTTPGLRSNDRCRRGARHTLFRMSEKSSREFTDKVQQLVPRVPCAPLCSAPGLCVARCPRKRKMRSGW